MLLLKKMESQILSTTRILLQMVKFTPFLNKNIRIKWLFVSDSNNESAKNVYKYSFESAPAYATGFRLESQIRVQVLTFLDSPTTKREEGKKVHSNWLIHLERNELIKNVFTKYNTFVPSSAPVERIFSHGSMWLFPFLEENTFYIRKNILINLFLFTEYILRPHRLRLKDALFEKLLFLKINYTMLDNQVKANQTQTWIKESHMNLPFFKLIITMCLMEIS